MKKKMNPKPRAKAISIRNPELVAAVAAFAKSARLTVAGAAAMLIGEALDAKKAGAK
jgi:hypothetical protein